MLLAMLPAIALLPKLVKGQAKSQVLMPPETFKYEISAGDVRFSWDAAKEIAVPARKPVPQRLPPTKPQVPK
jgi:hypothetical protein